MERRRELLVGLRTQTWRNIALQRPGAGTDHRGGDREAFPLRNHQRMVAGTGAGHPVYHHIGHRHRAGSLFSAEADWLDGPPAEPRTPFERRAESGCRIRHHAAEGECGRGSDQQKPLRTAFCRVGRSGRVHYRFVRAVSRHFQRGVVLRQGNIRFKDIPEGAERYIPRKPDIEPRPDRGMPYTLRIDKRYRAV